MAIRKPEDPATIRDITDVLNPLFFALHERGVIPFGEMAMLYEDILAMRTIDNGEGPDSTDFLRQIVVLLHRLAVAAQERERAAKEGTDAPPSA